MSKQLIGTSLFATSSQITLQIPVAESFLPTQAVKGVHHDLPKQLVYSNDSRNPHFSMRVAACDGAGQEQEHQLQFSKEELARFFQQLEKIQDELNTYM